VHRYFEGGRFDSTHDDTYGYLYAGDTPAGAVAETLLRDSPITATGAITLSHTQVVGRRLTRIMLTQDLAVVDLRGLVDLRAASQDTWLTMADPSDYPQTRHWGHWIRSQSPTATGFIWISKRDPTRQSYVFFDDKCPPNSFAADPTWRPNGIDPYFDDAAGLQYLTDLLQPFAADVSPPAP
jgi:RES domain